MPGVNYTLSFDELLDGALRKCANCGSCQAVCPVYGLGREEGQCARGKLQLARAWRDGQVETTIELAAVFSQCGLCGRCAGACSNGVQTTAVFKAMRANLVKAGVVNPLVSKGVGKVFSNPPLLRTGLALGTVATSLAAKVIPPDSGIWLRLPMLKGLDGLAAQPVAPYIKDTPIVIQKSACAPRLVLFAGCMGNLLFHDLMESAIKLFSKKYTVIVPAGQGCCGLPAISAGDNGTANRLARRNLEVLAIQKADVITTVCASCTFGLRDSLIRLGEHRLAGKVLDSVEVLADMPELLSCAMQGWRVNLHVSCHLGGAGQTHLRDALFDLLKISKAKNVHTLDLCCGGGGLLPVNTPDLSGRLAKMAIKDFSGTPTDTVVTGCSGCRIQWMRHLHKNVRVLHPLELLR